MGGCVSSGVREGYVLVESQAGQCDNGFARWETADIARERDVAQVKEVVIPSNC